ncbi:TKL protein kinase, variant [Aphanomyces invadans]|nr:TKL protein kinase, variant [Aphanomyces invadans]ETV95675.1 TKL protein kinase, variant [Aphanomyces invadans]|eukprot:XP_008875868.1 TKL protein kinase, variant [Aphanomyces invadans]
MDELLVMSKLVHPNVVEFIGACIEPPNLCFVMELCSMSLYDQLHGTNEPISVSALVKMATSIASAMQYLHSLTPAIVHRDLKSQNVLLDATGTVKLCDFGLVCTKEGTAGTPAYMPPELLAGKPFSKAVDVHMFGMLLWEMFARDIPFRGYAVDDIQRKVLHGDRPSIPTIDCPPSCQDLMRQCWSAEPSHRPTFDAIHRMLSAVDVKSVVHAVDNIMEEDALDSLMMGGKKVGGRRK